MGDQQRRLLQLLLDLQHLVAEQQPRLLVERRERLVHQQDFRLGGERARHRYALAHAAGEFGRVVFLEAVEADERHEMPRPLDALALGKPAISSGKATLSTTLRQGNVDSSWNTMPMTGCGPDTFSPATVTLPS